jgi:hypothetical protein
MNDARHAPSAGSAERGPLDAELGYGLEAGSRHYRAFVGPPEKYDLVAAMQFNLLTALGLREHHYLCDIGCGSLRAGRLFIPYLLPGRYFGIEPEAWLVEEGIQRHLGSDQVRLRRPTFAHRTDFALGSFGQPFDFVLAQSIFTHAAGWQIELCLREARAAMRPEAALVVSFREGETDYQGREWVYPGSVKYTLGYLQRLAAGCGLRCERIGWPHPNKAAWIAFSDLSAPSFCERVQRSVWPLVARSA